MLKPVPLASLSALPLFATMMLAGILAWCETTKHGRPHAYLRFPIALYQHVSQRRARNTSYKLDMKCSFWQVFQNLKLLSRILTILIVVDIPLIFVAFVQISTERKSMGFELLLKLR